MKTIFRVDASLQIGTGHVMRCLTLADALAAQGADCQFICRAHEGHLIEFIRSKGYVLHTLPAEPLEAVLDGLAHSYWLGVSQAQDAVACISIVAKQRPDWLVVDHYALDAQWENALALYCQKLMVIDDLADREHACQLLLDQTFGRTAGDYQPYVPASCQLLCGSEYALLRPEFAALRSYSLHRRGRPMLRELLITMGGVDKDNATGQVLQALQYCRLPIDCKITVVMGITAPWLDKVRSQANDMPWTTRVLVGVKEMAQLMADSDLAIGAAGATSWERCCLGLPTIMFVLASNQHLIAQGLERAGAVKCVYIENNIGFFINEIICNLTDIPVNLLIMSESAASIVNGDGVKTVLQKMEVRF